MTRNTYSIRSALLCFCFLALFLNQCSDKSEKQIDHQGLVGAWYHDDDLTRIGTSWKLDSLDKVWDAVSGRGNAWSAQWEGFILAPATDKVTFCAESNKEYLIEIDGELIVHVDDQAERSCGTVEMVQDKKYPIRVKYLQHSGGEAYFKTLWSWGDEEAKAVPAQALSFNDRQAEWWHYSEKPDPETFDFGQLNTIPVDNYIAYYEPGRFAGWPANNGAWHWGDEILVGFEQGYHDPNPTGGHAILGDKPSHNVLARSLDGGVSWTVEDPDHFVDDPADEPENYKDSPGINFTHPDFAFRLRNDRYFVSYDRGKSWQGPYRVVVKADGENLGDLTSRTDYIVLGPDESLVFMSAETGLVESNYQDRSFCALTTDGGKTFQFLGWMTHDTEVRSVMSSTVYAGQDHLVSVVRRKHEQIFDERPGTVKNWIEAEESRDNGKTWETLGKVAETGDAERNGNPPALVKLPDGRLCVAYGYRAFPYGIRIKVSEDNGKSWGGEIVLRSDGATWDLGYPRMIVRPDGKAVVMYYYTTKDHFEQHIGVTIFDPADIP